MRKSVVSHKDTASDVKGRLSAHIRQGGYSMCDMALDVRDMQASVYYVCSNLYGFVESNKN